LILLKTFEASAAIAAALVKELLLLQQQPLRQPF